jgi:uncharacterized membrane protein
MTYTFKNVEKYISEEDEHKIEISGLSQGFIYTSLICTIVGLLVVLYIALRGTPYEPHMMEWLNLIVRLMHITFGIAWIGASFYFVFLENSLNRTENVRDELAGNLWAIHGGGFYYLEKYKTAPKEIPKELHWFKYEAYFTFLSGFCMLFIVYYFNATTFLIDKNIANVSPLVAVTFGIGSLIVGWIIYDLLCKSPLIKKPVLFSIIGFIIAAAFAYFYAHIFSGRAAFMHFGAMLGTIMAANVFFVIIPSQKAMVKAAKEGKDVDPKMGKNAGLRSLHNNYFTLPVLFVMISNHFPSTFGSQYAWIVLLLISVGLAGVKHYLNLQEKKQLNVWILPASILIILGVAFMTSPKKNTNTCDKEISFAEVNTIIQARCIACHSSHPTDKDFSVAPNGVMYDTGAEIQKYKDKIMQRAVLTQSMPLGNKTNMTQEERDILRCWLDQGAQIK